MLSAEAIARRLYPHLEVVRDPARPSLDAVADLWGSVVADVQAVLDVAGGVDERQHRRAVLEEAAQFLELEEEPTAAAALRAHAGLPPPGEDPGPAQVGDLTHLQGPVIRLVRTHPHDRSAPR